MKPTYFFSFRSPYSWLASLSLKRRIDERDEFELVPFWEPDQRSAKLLQERKGEFPYRTMSDAKHRYILKDIGRLTKSFDLKITWPVDPSPWWELSHLGYLKAVQFGFGKLFFWAMYDARWLQGKNISEPDAIASVCKSIGMNEEQTQAVLSAPDDEEIRQQGADILYRIYREDVFGVPMFTYKRKQYWGIDRLRDFLADLELNPLNQEELPLAPRFALDLDHAGGCG